MHIPYKQSLNRLPDFEVTYQLYTHEDGGRHSPPYQGIRWDFQYEERPKNDSYWMIYPEFLDSEGNVLLDEAPVPMAGRAFMWIVNPDTRSIHRERIHLGTRGLFMEGPRKVGVCEVTALIGLNVIDE